VFKHSKQISSLIIPFVLTGIVMGTSSARMPETIEADVTVAQALDLSSWYQDGVNAGGELVGTWAAGEGEVDSLQILPFPVADNAVLVSRGNRLVPAFLRTIEGQDWLVVASGASEQFEMIPELWWIGTRAGEAVLMRVASAECQSLVSPDALPSILQDWVEARAQPSPDAPAYRRKAG
jgi:hypothetical protein